MAIWGFEWLLLAVVSKRNRSSLASLPLNIFKGVVDTVGVRLDFTSVFRALHIVRSRAQTALASVEIVEQQGHTTFLSYS